MRTENFVKNDEQEDKDMVLFNLEEAVMFTGKREEPGAVETAAS